MYATTHRARRSAHLSRHERQHLARAEAFSRRTRTAVELPPVTLKPEQLELIDRLVRRDRTVVSTAVLAIAGIGGGQAMRRAVLARVGEAACWAQAEGAIGAQRASQITRHVRRALPPANSRLAV